MTSGRSPSHTSHLFERDQSGMVAFIECHAWSHAMQRSANFQVGVFTGGRHSSPHVCPLNVLHESWRKHDE